MGLSKENILSRTTEAEIYRHFLGHEYNVGTLFSSPLPDREDPNPSFGIYLKNGELLWNDFGDVTKGGGGDVFKFVQRMENIDFLHALIMINDDMHLGVRHSFSNAIKSNQKKREYALYKHKQVKKNAHIQIIIQNYTNADLRYWLKGGVTKKTLEFFKIYSVEKLYYNFIKLWEYSTINPIYAWELTGQVKGYRPKEIQKNYKWINNCTGDQIQGYDQLPKTGNLLVITKSMKDIAVLYEIGLPACAPQAEGIMLSEEKINELQDRFDNVIVLFDNDEAGLNAARKYEYMHGLPYVYLPLEKKAKDCYEFVEKYSLTQLKEFLL